ncbi:MAG: hypothetical protein HY954_09765 [Deltaproteobacteria bacterium]|nr:hypothetical protein [Deltaproteobacteria bacterium]
MAFLRQLLIIASIFFLSGVASAAEERFDEPKVDYSAKGYMETNGHVMNMTVFYSPGKERREFDGGMAMIIRRDKKVAWQLMQQLSKYKEIKMEDASQDSADLHDFKIERKVLGSEVVDGINTTRSKVLMTDKKGNKYTGFMWVTKEGIMAKLDATADFEGTIVKMKMGLRSIKIGKLDPKLFELPQGYTNMDDGFMKNMFKAAETKEPAPAAKTEPAADMERSYTESERDYTARSRSTRKAAPAPVKQEPSASETATDTAKKLWKLFGK